MPKKRSVKKIEMGEECCSSHKWSVKCCKCNGAFGGIYFLGFIGSAVYYIQNATSFGMGFVGFLKALVWPAFLVHKLLGL
jgi:hypothetical protein